MVIFFNVIIECIENVFIFFIYSVCEVESFFNFFFNVSGIFGIWFGMSVFGNSFDFFIGFGNYNVIFNFNFGICVFFVLIIIIVMGV